MQTYSSQHITKSLWNKQMQSASFTWTASALVLFHFCNKLEVDRIYIGLIKIERHVVSNGPHMTWYNGARSANVHVHATGWEVPVIKSGRKHGKKLSVNKGVSTWHYLRWFYRTNVHICLLRETMAIVKNRYWIDYFYFYSQTHLVTT